MAVKTYLISRPRFEPVHGDFLATFLPPGEAHWTEPPSATDAERIIEFAGRICYMSFGSKQSPRTNREYIHNLIRNGHESVLEHAVWTVSIAGVSRAFTHQLVRHRVGFSFSQLSQQYHDESEARFVPPHELRNLPDLASVWDESVRASQAAYRMLLHGLANREMPIGKEARRALRSAARSVLPNAVETAIAVTANARALRNFFKLRAGIVGDSEMRLVSASLFSLLCPEAPSCFDDFDLREHEDGLPIIAHRPH